MAAAYNQALLAPGRKKSMQRIAGHVNVDEDRVEQFVRESPWEYERHHVHLNRNIPGTIRSENGAFIVDEVGITKQGRHSLGVQRQYNGAQGKSRQLTGCRRSHICRSGRAVQRRPVDLARAAKWFLERSDEVEDDG